MAAIDFPDSPTLEQVFTVDGRSWVWNGTTWDVVSTLVQVAATGPTGATGDPGKWTVSATAPSSPSTGDSWFDSNNSALFIYYDGFWVEATDNLHGPTGPTGPAPDTSTYASKTYADNAAAAAAAAIVDSAPGTLDTLNELAAALGDDANFATTVTNALAAKAPLASPTLSNPVFTGASREGVYTSGTGFAGYTFDVTTNGAVQYITANSTANGTVNFRSTSGVSLNTLMATNQAITIVLAVTNGATAYYPTAYQIDGTSVTLKWSGGTAPTSGNASAIDIYTFTIIKTASATFTVLASQVKFA